MVEYSRLSCGAGQTFVGERAEPKKDAQLMRRPQPRRAPLMRHFRPECVFLFSFSFCSLILVRSFGVHLNVVVSLAMLVVVVIVLVELAKERKKEEGKKVASSSTI